MCMGWHASCTLRKLHSAAAGCSICAAPPAVRWTTWLHCTCLPGLPSPELCPTTLPLQCTTLLPPAAPCTTPLLLPLVSISLCKRLHHAALDSRAFPFPPFSVLCQMPHCMSHIAPSNTRRVVEQDTTPAACSSALLSSPCSTFCHGPRGPGGGRWRDPLRSI